LGDWKNSAKGVLAGAATGTALGLAGFWLAEIPATHAMGWVMFFIVPLGAGFAIAMVTNEPNQYSAAAVLATLVSIIILVAGGYETVLCAVLVLPALFVALSAGIAIGIGFRSLTRKSTGKNATFTSLILLSVPLAIVAGHRFEVKKLIHPRREIVTTTIRLAAEPTETWAALRSFDSLTASKPLLMYVGLPVPVRCLMRGSGIGAKRTCYFDRGYIEETVTQWDPPFVMGLSIDRTNMPGRHWLSFEDARYELHRDGSETVLTRTTTVSSNLYPVWYWRPFERWGVTSEHEYIFRDLARRLKPTVPQRVN
jgi:Polyketide cyclase / dehydrase and lipid transport